MIIEAVDLFCGIGGLTCGIKKAGIKVIAGIDIDITCKYTYEENNAVAFIEKAVEDVASFEIEKLYTKGSIRMLMGCAPCQPFSRYSYRYNKEGYRDDKWKLLYEFARLVKDIKPCFVSMENVPKLSNTSVFNDFVAALNEENYYVSWSIVNCADYGIAQNRKRLVLLASKLGDISIIDPIYDETNYRTVRDAIGNMEIIKDGDTSKTDPVHRASKLSKKNLLRIKQSTPGGTWQDWDKSLILKCHKKASGKTYKSVYGRMDWDKPAPTITTQFYGYGNGRFGHPVQNRAISLREGAILQSFPPTYKFFDGDDKPTNREIGTHIGNAVPVQLGLVIGQSIIRHLKNKEGESIAKNRL